VQDSHSKGHVDVVAVIKAARGVIQPAEKLGRDVAGVDVQPCGIAGVGHKEDL